MKITYLEYAKMIDASSLKLDTSYDDYHALVAACKKYSFGCVFIWPAYYPEICEAFHPGRKQQKPRCIRRACSPALALNRWIW